MDEPFPMARVPEGIDAFAPDGSEIRFLVQTDRASAVHCRLPSGGVSKAVHHRTVEEIWFFLAGRGEVWRKQDGQEKTVEVEPGMCLSIPVGTAFQFRTIGETALEFFIVTVPPWPGPDEAMPVEDHWRPHSAGRPPPT